MAAADESRSLHHVYYDSTSSALCSPLAKRNRELCQLSCRALQMPASNVSVYPGFSDASAVIWKGKPRVRNTPDRNCHGCMIHEGYSLTDASVSRRVARSRWLGLTSSSHANNDPGHGQGRDNAFPKCDRRRDYSTSLQKVGLLGHRRVQTCSDQL
jgi:hypothetical protein